MAADLQRLRQIKNRAAVVGVGASPQGTFPDSDPYTLAIQAFRNALDDCGLKKSDIDGLIVQGPGNVSFVRMGEMLGINPVVGANFDVGGLACQPFLHVRLRLVTPFAAVVEVLDHLDAARIPGELRRDGAEVHALEGLEPLRRARSEGPCRGRNEQSPALALHWVRSRVQPFADFCTFARSRSTS